MACGPCDLAEPIVRDVNRPERREFEPPIPSGWQNTARAARPRGTGGSAPEFVGGCRIIDSCSISEMSVLLPPRAHRNAIRKFSVQERYTKEQGSNSEKDQAEWCEAWYPGHRADCTDALDKGGSASWIDALVAVDDGLLTRLCCGDVGPSCAFLSPVRGTLRMDSSSSQIIDFQMPLFYWGDPRHGVASITELMDDYRSYSLEVRGDTAKNFRRRMERMFDASRDPERLAEECQEAQEAQARRAEWMRLPRFAPTASQTPSEPAHELRDALGPSR